VPKLVVLPEEAELTVIVKSCNVSLLPINIPTACGVDEIMEIGAVTVIAVVDELSFTQLLL
jgi:hypothetical protein